MLEDDDTPIFATISARESRKFHRQTFFLERFLRISSLLFVGTGFSRQCEDVLALSCSFVCSFPSPSHMYEYSFFYLCGNKRKSDAGVISCRSTGEDNRRLFVPRRLLSGAATPAAYGYGRGGSSSYGPTATARVVVDRTVGEGNGGRSSCGGRTLLVPTVLGSGTSFLCMIRIHVLLVPSVFSMALQKGRVYSDFSCQVGVPLFLVWAGTKPKECVPPSPQQFAPDKFLEETSTIRPWKGGDLSKKKRRGGRR